MMEIRCVGVIPGVRISPEVFHRNAISAAVAVRRTVQGLVQVPHKMNDIAQRCSTLRSGRALILQNGELVRDGLKHAPSRATETLRRAVRRAQGNVDEVPWRGGRLSAALIVGPS